MPLCLIGLTLVTACAAEGAPEPAPWGADGHEMAAAAAFAVLPADMPSFFRGAGDQLGYLNPEPDRWRERELRAMDEAWSYDHYIDLENVVRVPGAVDATDRFRYLRALYEDGLGRPERDGGFLPFRILEMYERLVTEWRLWRAADGPRREWIAQRIINDAGILGHYVSDASQPHHTTIHFNGWNRDAPNPHGFTYADDFHYRFESAFVRAHVRPGDVASRVTGRPQNVAGSARSAVWDHIREAHAEVETLYRLEQDFGFDPDGNDDARTRDFAAERIAAGARVLATLWWSAWLESAGEP